MACEDYNGNLHEALTNFSHVTDAGICPYTADAGAGLGLAMFGLFVFTSLGLGLTIRTRHPGPVMVGGILSSGMMAAALPGLAAKILALVLFAGISGIGIWIYSRARTTL